MKLLSLLLAPESFLHSNTLHRSFVHPTCEVCRPRSVVFRSGLAQTATATGTSKQLHPIEAQRGTACCRAPEVLAECATYNNGADIWALGCILFELCTGKKAFHSDWATRDYAVSNTSCCNCGRRYQRLSCVITEIIIRSTNRYLRCCQSSPRQGRLHRLSSSLIGGLKTGS